MYLALKRRDTGELGSVWSFHHCLPNMARLKADKSLKPIP